MCCPPCSVHGVTEKLAFSAPRSSAYWPTGILSTIGSPQNPHHVTTADLGRKAEVFWITTERKKRICCTYVSSGIDDASVILYCHSNADDLGTVYNHLRDLSRTLYCDVFCYDYCGYGLSEGKSSVSNFYADAEAAYLSLRFYYALNPDQIIIYGSSLGSVAAAHLAAKYTCKGLVLMASVSSGIRLLCGTSVLPFGCRDTFPFDVLDNISLAAKIKCPTLVIHGEDDQLCYIEGARALVKKLQFAVEPGFYPNVGHDEVTLTKLSCFRISNFVHSDCNAVRVAIHEGLESTNKLA